MSIEKGTPKVLALQRSAMFNAVKVQEKRIFFGYLPPKTRRKTEKTLGKQGPTNINCPNFSTIKFTCSNVARLGNLASKVGFAFSKVPTYFRYYKCTSRLGEYAAKSHDKEEK